MEIRSIGAGSPPPQTTEQTTPSSAPAAAARPTAAPAAVVATDIAVQASAPVPGSAQLAQALGHLNQTMKTRESGLEFSIDEDSHRTVIKVVDQNTKELIRQMPSEEALQLAKALDQAQQGLLINQKA